MEEAVQQTDRMLVALAEQLKAPLIQIAQLAEIDNFERQAASIGVLSKQALRSIDALVFVRQQTILELEPVSVGAVLYDVAHELTALAQQNNIEIEINQRGNRAPIMAHTVGLKTLLELAGDVLLRLAVTGDTPGKQRLLLGCHPTIGGQMVGVFQTGNSLSQAGLNAARKLYGRAGQASPLMSLQGGASLVVADSLAVQLHSALKVYQHVSLKGLGAAFAPSKQLRLVS